MIYESGRKTQSKSQRPEMGRASSWELRCFDAKLRNKIIETNVIL